jgi:hypothetical protein
MTAILTENWENKYFSDIYEQKANCLVSSAHNYDKNSKYYYAKMAVFYIQAL